MSDLPNRDEYRDFISKLSTQVEGLGIECILYGSVARDQATYGLSDIDAFFVINCNFISDKSLLRKLSKHIADSDERGDLPLQFSFLDSSMIRDGRFVTYGGSFENVFRSEGMSLGNDELDHILDSINFETYRHEVESKAAFNLAKARQRLVMLDHDHTNHWQEYCNAGKVRSTLNQMSRGVTEIRNRFVGESDYSAVRSSNKTLDFLSDHVPGFNREVFEEIKRYEGSILDIQSFQDDVELYRRVIESGLTEFERCVKWYCSLSTTEQTISVKTPIL